jgi:hypothetical protein
MAPPEFRYRCLGAVAMPIQVQSRLLSPTASVQPPEQGCAIKGNLKSAQQCIYHIPGGTLRSLGHATECLTRLVLQRGRSPGGRLWQIQALAAGQDNNESHRYPRRRPRATPHRNPLTQVGTTRNHGKHCTSASRNIAEATPCGETAPTAATSLTDARTKF